MDIRKVVLVYPGREGLILGRAHRCTLHADAPGIAGAAGDPGRNLGREPWAAGRQTAPAGAERPGGHHQQDAGHRVCGALGRLAHRRRRQDVVVGGTHATLDARGCGPLGRCGVTGEAYTTWPQIIQDVLNDTLQAAIPRHHLGRPGRSGDHHRSRDPMMDENRNYWTPMMEITRGCPRNCSFCTAIRVSGQRMRLRPIDEVVDEIQRRRIRRFFLTDDNFGLAFRTNPDYIEALFKALVPLPLHGWTVQAEMIGQRPPRHAQCVCLHRRC